MVVCCCKHFASKVSNPNKIAFVSGTEGLRFKSLTGQIKHSVANGLPPLRHSSNKAVLGGRNDAEMGPVNS